MNSTTKVTECEAALWCEVEAAQAKGYHVSQRTISDDYVMVRMFRGTTGCEILLSWEAAEA